MGGTDITSTAVDKTSGEASTAITISVPTVTGNISIKFTSTYNGGTVEPEEPTNYTFTINPTPSTATVTLTASGYTQSGNSITVANGTSVSWTVSASGYTTQSGTQVVTSTSSKNITLSASGEPTPVVGWFSNQIEQPSLSTTIDLSSAPYGYTDELCASYYNKPVNKIRLKVATPGVVSFGVCSADRKSIVSTYTINVVTGTDEYDIPETFTLAEGQGIWWQTKTDTGKSYCTIKANDKLGTFYSKVGTNSLVQPHNNNYSLGFDLGYFE